MTTNPTSATRNRTWPGMSHGTRLRPEVTDDSRLAKARERFLTAEPIEPGQVRDTILASWRRSREWHVPGARPHPSFAREPHPDPPPPPAAPPGPPHPTPSLPGHAGRGPLTPAHAGRLAR